MPELNLHFLIPEIILSVVGLLVLVGDATSPKRQKLWMILSALAVIISGIYVIPSFSHGGEALGMAAVDAHSGFFKLTLLAAVLIVLAMCWVEKEFGDVPRGTIAAILLFSSVGLLLLVSSSDFLLFLISFRVRLIGDGNHTSECP